MRVRARSGIDPRCITWSSTAECGRPVGWSGAKPWICTNQSGSRSHSTVRRLDGMARFWCRYASQSATRVQESPVAPPHADPDSPNLSRATSGCSGTPFLAHLQIVWQCRCSVTIWTGAVRSWRASSASPWEVIEIASDQCISSARWASLRHQRSSASGPDAVSPSCAGNAATMASGSPLIRARPRSPGMPARR